MQFLAPLLLIFHPFSFLHCIEGFSNLLHQYDRPITVIYISKNPRFIKVKENDIIVYWTQNKKFQDEILRHRPRNCVIISTKINAKMVARHAKFAPYDVAIIDAPISVDDIVDQCHLADHTFILNPDTTLGLEKLGTDLYYLAKSKGDFYQRSKNPYKIVSTFESKFMLTKKRREKRLWLSGLAMREFFLFKGSYPSEKDIWKQVIENYNPIVSTDYKIKNLILQGDTVHVIDYNPKNEIPQEKSEPAVLATSRELMRKYKFFSNF